MKDGLLRLFLAAGLGFLAVLLVLISLARHNESLLGPLDFFMAAVILAIYLLPAIVAVYRDCASVVWIVLLNILTGWTILGWIAALGWANGGKPRTLPPAGHPPAHPLPTQ